jgi:hypothetical protein
MSLAQFITQAVVVELQETPLQLVRKVMAVVVLVVKTQQVLLELQIPVAVAVVQ